MNIAEVRAKYPQYSDLSDEDLAKGLHQKFYSDMEFSEFSKKIGLSESKDVVQPESSPMLEYGKGLVRGASNLGLGVARSTSNLLLGPVFGPLAATGAESIAEPSRQLVPNKAITPAEKFASTAGEITGGGIAGGGAGTLRGAAITGGGAVGGAYGEQAGGPIGTLIGTIAGSFGTSAAYSIGRKLGMAGKDLSAMIAAGLWKSKWGTNRLASKFVTEEAGENASEIKKILTAPQREGPQTSIVGMKPTVGEVLTKAQAGKEEQIGGRIIRLQRDLYGAKGVEDVLPSTAKQQQAAIGEHLKELTKTTTPMREASLDAANSAGGVRIAPLIEGIRQLGKKPGPQASEVVIKSLDETAEKIAKHTETGGRIDAHNLYTIRKEIGNTIEKFSKESANWDKKLSAGLQRDVQRLIDDAIEASGGVGWKKYLGVEYRGRQLVDDFKENLDEMRLIQSKTKPGVTNFIAQREVTQAPTLLHRGMMAFNYGLRLIGQDANDPVVKKVTTSMQNPDEFAKLIKLPLNHPERKALHYVINQLAATGVLDKLPQIPVPEELKEYDVRR